MSHEPDATDAPSSGGAHEHRDRRRRRDRGNRGLGDVQPNLPDPRRRADRTRQPAAEPCTLVTLSAAQGIVQAIAQADEAPLGPTCIYKRGDGKAPITLTVGLLNYAKVTEGLKSTTTVNIGKHTGVCGTRGEETLYLPLGSDRVLNVVAPCGTAKALAAIATRNLGG